MTLQLNKPKRGNHHWPTRVHGSEAQNRSGDLLDDVVERGRRPNRTDCLKVRKVSFDNVDRIDVVEQIDVVALRLPEEIRRETVFGHHDGLGDVLGPVDHLVGLQTLAVQPLHVKRKELLDLTRCEASLTLNRETIADEVNRFIECVHGTRGNGIKPNCFPADRDRCDDKHEQGSNDGEHDRDQIHTRSL